MVKMLAVGLFLILAPFFICGCPYESDVPLSRISEAKIDQALIGSWQPTDGEEKEKGEVIFYPFNDQELIILSKEEKKAKVDLFRAFVTIVGGEKFLNVQEIIPSRERQKWNFVNYQITGDELRYRIVEDKIFKGKTLPASKPLYEFLKKNLKDKELYGPDEKGVLKRKKE